MRRIDVMKMPHHAAALIQARMLCREYKRGSISLVQRRMQISYDSAARLLEELEREGTLLPMMPKGGRLLAPPGADGQGLTEPKKMGRPPVLPEKLKRHNLVIRVTDEQLAKFKALKGPEWFRKALHRAKLPQP